MATLTDTSADGTLDARYLSDRRGVLLRAKFKSSPLYAFDFEPFGSEIFGDAIVSPTVRSSATVASNSGTSTVVPLPSGWQPGDLCYISWSVLAGSPSLTVPSGWTAKVTATVSGQNSNLMHGVIRRILQAGDGSVTITRASGRFAAVSMAIYDYDPADPDGTTPTKDSNSGVASSSVRAPSITSVKDTSLLITSHAVRNGTSSVTNMSFTPPPGMFEVAEVTSTSSTTQTAIEVARLTLGNAGATGTKTATLAGSKITDIQRVGSAILVRPKIVPATSFAGGFAWKNIGGRGTQSMNYNPPGTSPSALQYAATMIKSNGTSCAVDSSITKVTSEIGIPAVPATLPLIRGSNKYSSGTGSDTTSVVPYPTGWQAGDLCYLIYNVRGTTVSTTVPGGWSALVAETSFAGASSNFTFGVLKRVLQAGDSGTVSIAHTSGRFSATTVAITTGTFDTTTPEDVTPTTSTAAVATITVAPAPSITPTTDQCLILTGHLTSNNTVGLAMTFTPPSGMTELQDTVSGHTTSGNTAMELCSLQRGTGTNGVATGIKNATPASTDLTAVAVAGVTIAVRPKDQGTPAVPGVSGQAVSPAFNVSTNTLVVAMVNYNAKSTDAAGDKIVITNNKGVTVTSGVARDHLEGGKNGGAKIVYMWSSGAQTGMIVTATATGVDAAFDDLVLKVLLISNVDWPDLSPDGTLEGSSNANSKTVSMQSDQIEEGVALWAIMDGVTKGTPVITEPTWTAISPSTVSKTSTSPINGQQSLINSWTSGGQGISYTLPSSVKGEQCVRIWFKIKGSEDLSSAWTSSVGARLEVKAYSTSGYNWQTNTLGFPGNVERYWYTDFFVPKGSDLKKLTITGYGWDSNANARFDDIKIETIPPEAVRFVRKTDGGYVRGGDPAQAVLGTAYAFDDELTPNRDTEWYAEPIYSGGSVGASTDVVGFTIEDRSVDLPSTMIKSVETPGLVIFLPVDQKDLTRSRSTTFVNKQSTGKPAGGVNSAYSASGDYMLITQSIDEMNDLMTILDETVLYLSPTGRYNRVPFYATVSEYTILDFARMDGVEKIFNIRFQEVERPDTEGQPNYLPLRDYAWLQTQYATYGDLALTAITYDDLAFSAVP